MKSLCTLALAALLALPTLAAAQEGPSLPAALISVTPYIGGRVPLVSGRETTILLPGVFDPVLVSFEEEGGGGIAGAEVGLHLFGPIGLVGAFVYTNPDDLLLTTETEAGAITQVAVEGPSVWFAKAGVSYRLPEPEPDERRFHPAAYVSAGPALVREDYEGSLLGDPEGDGTVDSWAINIGVKAVQALGTPHVALFLAVEDYVTFWNPGDAERRRIERFLALEPGTILSADFDYDRTHVLMFNAGLSFRW